MSFVINKSEDSKKYNSPEFEIISIKLNSDILSSSGEGTLEPTEVHTLPPFTEEPLIPDD